MPGYVYYLYDISTERITRFPLNLLHFYRPQRKVVAEFGKKENLSSFYFFQ